LVAASTIIVASASLLIAAPGLAGAKPKPVPKSPPVSQGQVNTAQSQKDAVASQVGVLSGQVAQAKIELQQLEGKRELAEQKVAYAMSKLQLANQAADQARANVRKAQTNVGTAHTKFVQYIQATYTSGEVDGAAGSLLTATDPSQLLEQSALEQYQEQHQADAIGQLEQATVAKSNADAKARLAVLNRRKAAAEANAEKQAADNAVAAEKVQEAALRTSMAQKQRELNAARAHLADLTHQRAAYLAYVAYQARLAAWRARQARLARERAAREAARLARERAREQQHQSNGGGVPISSGPSAPSGGHWTAHKGRKAADRALSQVGWPYAWAGGGVYGPSFGVCDASNGAPNDCNVRGYDCSGLAMFAWGEQWAHYAATQYTEAGRVHPSQLRPGDLVFWSSNGRISGIHHVALYIGGGQIVEAPFSGGYVQVASVYEYGSYFGATRPLS
jgi:cell wall-associated NlpC family hydrolase